MSRVVAFLARLDVRRMAAFLLGGVAVMGVVGTISQVLYKGIWWFGLDAEVYIGSPLTTSTIAFPALYSGLLLIGAGIAWLAVACTPSDLRSRPAAVVLGLAFLLMAGDEVVAVHEWLETTTGIDWQALYAGPMLLLGIAALWMIHRTWNVARGSAVLLLSGGAAWGIAQVLELIQWYGTVKDDLYVLMMIPEEVLEAGGSALFALSAVVLIQRLVAVGQPATADRMADIVPPMRAIVVDPEPSRVGK